MLARRFGLATALLLAGAQCSAPAADRDDVQDEPADAGGGGGAGAAGGRAGTAGGTAGAGGAPGGRDAGPPVDARAAADAGGGDADPGGLDGGAEVRADTAAQKDASPDGAPPGLVDPRSPVLPVLMIDVSPVLPTAIAGVSATTKTRGTMKVYVGHLGRGTAAELKADLDRRTPVLQTPIGIKVRGKVSSRFPKKPYSLDLLDERGMERALPFLGMPKDADWVLHPCYADVTCVRNALVYELAQGLGRYNPRSQHAEVFINGQYWGHYLVVEKPKFDDTRIPLKRAAATSEAGDITGAYLIRNEFLGNGRPTDAVPQDFVSKHLPIIYSYGVPSPEQITAEQKTYVHGIFDRLDALARSAAFTDPVNGYPRLIDLPSWVDFALFQEFTNNCDAYLKSVYMQKLPDAMGGKIALGPLWDFDFALANVSFRDTQRTDVWAFNMNRFGGERSPYDPPGIVPYVPLYWEKLWKDPRFLNQAKCRWRELRRPGGVLDLANITAKLDMLVGRLAYSEPRDHARWPTINTSPCCGIKAFPTYKGYVDWLREWIPRRLSYMDQNLPGTCP